MKPDSELRLDVINEITPESYNERIRKHSSDKVVIIDFWASWCAPCGVLNFVLKKLIREEPDRLVIFKLDCEEFNGFAREEGIVSLPALKLYYKNNLRETIFGTVKLSDLQKKVNDIITKKGGIQ